MVTATSARPKPFPSPASRRHWLMLIVAILLVQGALYFSYPLPVPGRDDNQAAQVFMMDDLASGNLLIGNLRYNTGYPLVMWPFRALTRLLGPNHDRFFLLIQLAALAAVALGLSTLARLNFAPVAAVFGLSFLLWRHIPRRERLKLLGIVSLIAGGILGAYTLVIHLPSTGTTRLSCLSGMNLLLSAKDKRIGRRLQ